jgi:hypothetical protein
MATYNIDPNEFEGGQEPPKFFEPRQSQVLEDFLKGPESERVRELQGLSPKKERFETPQEYRDRIAKEAETRAPMPTSRRFGANDLGQAQENQRLQQRAGQLRREAREGFQKPKQKPTVSQKLRKAAINISEGEFLAGAREAAEATIDPFAIGLTEPLRNIGVLAQGLGLDFAQGQSTADYLQPKQPMVEGLGAQLIQGAGGLVPFLGTGALPGVGAKVGTALLGAATNAGSTYEEAKKSGLDDQQALMAAIPGALIGMLEAYGGIGRGVEQFIKGGVKQAALEEFFQGAGSQILNNINARIVSGYDPGRAIAEGVVESGLLEGVLGGGLAGGLKGGQYLAGGTVKEDLANLALRSGIGTEGPYRLTLGEQKLFSGLPIGEVPKNQKEYAPWYYSALQQAVQQKFPSKMQPEQALKMLSDPQRGIKKEELEWSGLGDLIAKKQQMKEPVTKQELLDTLRENAVEIEEVELGKNPDEELMNDPAYRQMQDSLAEATVKYDDARIQYERIQNSGTEEEIAKARKTLSFTYNRKSLIEEKILKTKKKVSLDTQYSGFKALKGGKPGTYRELLLKLPPFKESGDIGKQRDRLQELSDKAEEVEARGGLLSDAEYAELSELVEKLSKTENPYLRPENEVFNAPHFGDRGKNLLAHIRFDEGTDLAGQRILRIQEIQSDWHQQGREKGYGSQDLDRQLREKNEELAKSGFYGVPQEEIDTLSEDEFFERTRRNTELLQEIQRLEDKRKRAIPDAPFKNTWHELALKRMIRYAAEQGFDKIVWGTGKSQIDLYQNELRQNVDKLEYVPVSQGYDKPRIVQLKDGSWTAGYGEYSPDGTGFDFYELQSGGVATGRTREDVIRKVEADLNSLGTTLQEDTSIIPMKLVAYKNGKQVFEQGMRREDLDQYVGPAVAQKLAENGYAEGSDLSIGGQVHKLLYDEKLPQYARQLAKKWGVEYGRTQIPVGDPSGRFTEFDENTGTQLPTSQEVHFLTIPPAFKKDVLYGGQKLFSNPIFDPEFWKQAFGRSKQSQLADVVSTEYQNQYKRYQELQDRYKELVDEYTNRKSYVETLYNSLPASFKYFDADSTYLEHKGLLPVEFEEAYEALQDSRIARDKARKDWVVLGNDLQKMRGSLGPIKSQTVFGRDTDPNRKQNLSNFLQYSTAKWEDGSPIVGYYASSLGGVVDPDFIDVEGLMTPSFRRPLPGIAIHQDPDRAGVIASRTSGYIPYSIPELKTHPEWERLYNKEFKDLKEAYEDSRGYSLTKEQEKEIIQLAEKRTANAIVAVSGAQGTNLKPLYMDFRNPFSPDGEYDSDQLAEIREAVKAVMEAEEDSAIDSGLIILEDEILDGLRESVMGQEIIDKIKETVTHSESKLKEILKRAGFDSFAFIDENTDAEGNIPLREFLSLDEANEYAKKTGGRLIPEGGVEKNKYGKSTWDSLQTGSSFTTLGPTVVGSRAWIPFYQEQLKSATGNRGGFDPSNPSILASKEAFPRTAEEMEQAARQLGYDVALTRETRELYQAQSEMLLNALMRVSLANEDGSPNPEGYAEMESLQEEYTTLSKALLEGEWLGEIDNWADLKQALETSFGTPGGLDPIMIQPRPKNDLTSEKESTNADFYELFIPPNPKRNPALTVPPHVLTALGFGGSGGIQFSIEDLGTLGRLIMKNLPPAESLEALKQLGELSRVVSERGSGSMILLNSSRSSSNRATSFFHESWHAGQQAAADLVERQITALHDSEWATNHPFVQKALQDDFGVLVGEGNIDLLATELPAYIAALQLGNFESLDVNEAVEFMFDYLEHIIDRNGIEALDRLAEVASMNPEVRELTSVARKKFDPLGKVDNERVNTRRGNTASNTGRLETGSQDYGSSSPRVLQSKETGPEQGGDQEADETSNGEIDPAEDSDELYSRYVSYTFLKEDVEDFKQLMREGGFEYNPKLPPMIQLFAASQQNPEMSPRIQAKLDQLGVDYTSFINEVSEAFSAFGRGLQLLSDVQAEWGQIFVGRNPEEVFRNTPAKTVINAAIKDFERGRIGKGMSKRAADRLRKMALGQLGITAVNVISTGGQIPVRMLSNGLAAGMQTLKTGKGSFTENLAQSWEDAQTAMQGGMEVIMAMKPSKLKEMMKTRNYVAQETQDVLDQIRTLFPDVYAKISGPKSVIEETQRSKVFLDLMKANLKNVKNKAERAKLEKKVNELIKRYERDQKLAGRIVQKIDMAYELPLKPATFQEFFFRGNYFIGELKASLERRGMDLTDVLSEIGLKNNKKRLAQLKPIFNQAMDEALATTYAYDPKYDKGNIERGAAKIISALNDWGPLGFAIEGFPKAVYNGLKFWYEFGPLGAIRPIKRAGAEDFDFQDYRRIGQAIVGTMMYATAWGLREALGGDEWWQIKTGRKRKDGTPIYLDIRRFQPFATYVWLVDRVERIAKGTMGDMTKLGSEFAEQYLSMRRAGDEGVGLFTETFDALGKYWAGSDSDAGIIKAQQSAGRQLALPLTPLLNLRDLIAEFSATEKLRRDPRESGIWGPSIDRIPWLRSRMLPEAASSTQPPPVNISENPFLGQLGLKFIAGDNFAGREWKRLGLLPSRFLQKDPDPKIDREQSRIFQELLNTVGSSWEKDPNYQAMSNANRAAMWEGLVSGEDGLAGVAKQMASVANVEELIKREKKRGIPPLQRKALEEESPGLFK